MDRICLKSLLKLIGILFLMVDTVVATEYERSSELMMDEYDFSSDLEGSRYDIASELGLFSQYEYRGVPQSLNESPAVQGAIDFRWPSGLYTGMWGSWHLDGLPGEQGEINYYVGQQFEFNGSVWNAGYILYDYLENKLSVEDGLTLDLGRFRHEGFFIGYWRNLRASLYYDFGQVYNFYMELHGRWQGPLKGEIYVTGGRQTFTPHTFLIYNTVSLGWERRWRDQWSLSMQYTSTSDYYRSAGSVIANVKWHINPEKIREQLSW